MTQHGERSAGKARLTVVDADRHVYVDDLDVGDVWLVPSGVSHSIQGLEEGTEFVLVFDDGNFSENQTLLITEVMAHLPRSVVAKNFGVPEAAFKDLPKEEKYIFRLPVSAALDTVRKQLPNDPPPLPYVFHASKVGPKKFDGGSTKVIDHRQFPETSLSALIINLEPGGLREIHWHPVLHQRRSADDGVRRDRQCPHVDYRAGDVGYVPKTLAHYTENTGTEPMQVINVFNSPRYSDLSLNQWLALTPPDLVRGTLDLGDTAMKALRLEFRPVVR